MKTWGEFAAVQPRLAAAGAGLFYEHGLGLGFLATVRADGGPRVHPICPVLTTEGVYAFVVDGPKLADLRRDSRYALCAETFPPPRHDDGFSVTGRARVVDDAALRSSLTDQLLAERSMSAPWPGFESEVLFELHVHRCLLTLTSARDGFPAGHTKWHDAG